MSNFIANARIAVYADTTAFSAALKKVVTQAEKTPIKIKLVPDPVGFIAEARKQLTRIEERLPPVSVKVIPDLTGFAAAVRGAALSAVAGINIPVGVTPAAAATRGAGAAAGAAAAGGASRSAITAEKALNDALAAGVFARRRISGEMSDQERRVLRLEREEAHLVAAENAVTKAIKEQNTVLADQAVRERAAAQAAVEKTRRQIAAPAVRGAAATSAEEKTAKQTAEQENLKKTNALLEQRRKFESDASNAAVAASLARQKALEKELKGLIAVDKATEDRIIKEQAAAAATRSRQSQIERSTRTRGLNVIGDRAIKQNEALETSADAAARAETQFAAARRHSAVAATKDNDLTAKLAATKAAERAATQGLAETEIALNEARSAALGSTSRELRDTAALRASQFDLAKGRAQEAEAATKQAQAQLAASGRLSASRRAIEATSAQLVGLRGAALSATGAFIATAAGAIALTKAVQSAAQLEATLNVFKVTAGATADQMKSVSDTARQLGRDISLPGVTAQSAADALLELSKAGLSVQDSIDGARGVLQLATAASIDNAQATELAANALNAFGLAGDQAVHVADVLANAANASQGSIVDMGVALQQASSVARQAGLSLEQTVGVLTIFARAGLRGSDAGTSFRTALIRLINPTTKAKKEIKELGLHLRTASGAINLKVFDEFAQKTRNLTAAQRDQALAIIFGQDAIRGAAILAREGAEGLDNQTAALNKQGTAAALAAARNAGFAGSMENLKNQVTDAGVTIGQVLIPPVTLFVDKAADMIKSLNDMASALVNATLRAGELGTSITDAARRAKNADFGGAPAIGKEGALAGLLGIKLPFTDTGLGDELEKATKAALKRGLDTFRRPPIPLKPPIKIDFSDQRTDLERGRDDFQQFINDLQDQTNEVQFNITVKGLQKLSARLKQGDKDAQKFAGDVDVVIKRLQAASAAPATSRQFQFPQFAIPRDLLTGEPGRLAAQAIAEKFQSTLTESQTANARALQDALFGGFADLGVETFSNQVNALGEKIKVTGIAQFAAAGTAWVKALKQALNQGLQALNKLDLKQLDLQIAGASDQALLQNARTRKKTQQGVVDRTVELQKDGKATLEDVKKQKQILAGIVGEIETLQGQIKSDAEKKAQDIKDARDKADQAFIDALAAARTPFERRVAVAETTPGGADNIQALVALRKRLLKEVQQTKAGVKDAKTRAKELQRLSDELFQNSLDIQAARKARDDAAEQALADKGVAIQSIGESTGSFKLIIRGIDLQIASAREVLAKARIAKTGIEAARAALEVLKKTRRDTINSAKDALLEQAFSLAEARGSKSAMLQIIDLQIAQAKAEQKQAKTLLDQLVAQTKIQELVNKRKEILADEVNKGQQGTSVLDLLRQNIQAFNASAGNLINANQPFAGPNAFNADIAQFLKFRGISGTSAAPRGVPGARGDFSFARGGFGAQEQKQTDLTNSLIAALEKLTEATLAASGNKSTARGAGLGSGSTPWAGRSWFAAGGWSRAFQDS